MTSRSGRASVKRLVERILLDCGPAALARRAHRSDCAVLAYHNIVPLGERAMGDRSLHLPQREFARQLDALLTRFKVVPLEALALAEPPSGPRVAITFDDAYAGAVTAGVAELVERGMSAHVFVVPNLLGRRSFWWDRLADPASGVVTSAVREHALWALGGEDERVRRWAEEEGLATQKPPPHARSATPEELDAAAGRPGITLGSHGWSHANLAALPEDALERELVESGDWLRRRYGAAHASWLSYPYGLTTDRVIESAARTYTRALRIAGGLADRRRLGTGAHSIPRINVPSGISRAGLLLRASGL